MQYKKLPKTYKTHISLMESRNINISNTEKAEKIIKHCNYYRLSAYCLPFEKSRHIVEETIGLDSILELYEFDRKLRLLLDEILEVVEISIRSILAYQLSHKYGTFAHINPANFKLSLNHSKWLEQVHVDTARSKEIFIEHYKNKYEGFPNLPIWMAVEVISFGRIVHLIHNLKIKDKIDLAQQFGLNYKIFCSWISSFNYIRNLCAHFGRLIHKDLRFKIMIPKYEDWEQYVYKNKVGIIIICLNNFAKNMDLEVFDLLGWKWKIEDLLEGKKNSKKLYDLIGLKVSLKDNPFWE